MDHVAGWKTRAQELLRDVDQLPRDQQREPLLEHFYCTMDLLDSYEAAPDSTDSMDDDEDDEVKQRARQEGSPISDANTPGGRSLLAGTDQSLEDLIDVFDSSNDPWAEPSPRQLDDSTDLLAGIDQSADAEPTRTPLTAGTRRPGREDALDAIGQRLQQGGDPEAEELGEADLKRLEKMLVERQILAAAGDFYVPFKSNDVADKVGCSHQLVSSVLQREKWYRDETLLADGSTGVRWFPARVDVKLVDDRWNPQDWGDLHDDDREVVWEEWGMQVLACAFGAPAGGRACESTPPTPRALGPRPAQRSRSTARFGPARRPWAPPPQSATRDFPLVYRS